MSELADFVLEAVRSALRGTMMELAGWAIVLLIVAVCGAVLYFLLRLAGVHLTVRSGLPYAEDTTGGLADDAEDGTRLPRRTVHGEAVTLEPPDDIVDARLPRLGLHDDDHGAVLPISLPQTSPLPRRGGRSFPCP